MSQCMIFCRTNLDCEVLEEYLCSLDGSRKFTQQMEGGKGGKYSCAVLGGMKSMTERRASLDAFKEGVVRFLICTDVAARGIDVRGLPFVINYTVPDEPEFYIHRIGRVGRAEHLGLAISLVAPQYVEEKVWYHVCSSRGKSCGDSRLKQDGGCAVWYNESEYFDAIQRRLDMAVPELGADMNLPESLAVLGSKYGERMAVVEEVVNPHLELIEPTVRELAGMEYEAQNIFLQLQSKYGKK
jgi:ATP-dependent RNA helicase DDX1